MREERWRRLLSQFLHVIELTVVVLAVGLLIGLGVEDYWAYFAVGVVVYLVVDAIDSLRWRIECYG